MVRDRRFQRVDGEYAYHQFAEFCRNSPLGPYIAKAGWICPSIHSFLDLSRIFYDGLPEALQEGEEDEDNE